MECETDLEDANLAACSSSSTKSRYVCRLKSACVYNYFKIIFRLNVCEVCAVNDAKYSCPRCEVKTCCLKCSQIHKKELDCIGERDRTKFIPVNKFTNIDLSSDYRLLEEISRNIVGYRKKLSKPNLSFPALPYVGDVNILFLFYTYL